MTKMRTVLVLEYLIAWYSKVTYLSCPSEGKEQRTNATKTKI